MVSSQVHECSTGAIGGAAMCLPKACVQTDTDALCVGSGVMSRVCDNAGWGCCGHLQLQSRQSVVELSKALEYKDFDKFDRRDGLT